MSTIETVEALTKNTGLKDTWRLGALLEICIQIQKKECNPDAE